MAERVEIIRQWLIELGVRIAPAIEPVEFRGRIAVLAGDLAEEFPAEAFTRASMLHVARKCPRYWPSFGELCDALQPWWRDHRPLPTAIPWQPAEPPRERTTEELEHVSKVTRRIVAELRHAAIEREAELARQKPTLRPPARQLTRAELNELYRREGLKGPEVPMVPELRVVAQNDP